MLPELPFRRQEEKRGEAEGDRQPRKPAEVRDGPQIPDEESPHNGGDGGDSAVHGGQGPVALRPVDIAPVNESQEAVARLENRSGHV